MASHHPSEASLLQYTAGGLDAASRAVLGAHVHGCAECRQAVRLAEAVGGQLLDGLAPETLAPDALAYAMARLDRPAPAPLPSPGTVMLDGIALPPSLHAYAGRLGRWRWVAPGIRHIGLLPARRTSGGDALYLLKLAPGTRVPEHGHGGREMVCVLAGGYSDRFGHFGPGDLVEADEAVEHQPVADAGAACICLVATNAPLRFRSRAARLLQPVLGF